jgi:Flp pilus assembly protein TadG
MKRLSNMRSQALALMHGFYSATAPGRACARARFIGGRLRAFLRSKSEGQSLVELALLLPMMMMLLTGIFSIGVAMCSDVALNNAVDVGARYLAIEGNTSGTTSGNLADPCQAVFSQMMGSSSTLNPANITVTYTLVNGASSTKIGPFTGTAANTCSNESAAFGSGGSFTIIATYPCNIGVYGVNFSGCQITASSNQYIYSNGT